MWFRAKFPAPEPSAMFATVRTERLSWHGVRRLLRGTRKRCGRSTLAVHAPSRPGGRSASQPEDRRLGIDAGSTTVSDYAARSAPPWVACPRQATTSPVGEPVRFQWGAHEAACNINCTPPDPTYLPSRSESPGVARSMPSLTRCQASRDACLARSHSRPELPRLLFQSRPRSGSTSSKAWPGYRV